MATLFTDTLLREDQRGMLAELEALALRLNRQLNLYSKESTQHFRERHLLHCLALASRPFPPGSDVVDWGTGGGMPGLPLAIAFPETTFHLVDSVGKKIRAVETMARRLELPNVRTYHSRAEQWQGSASYSVSRATSPLATLWAWHSRCFSPLDAPSDHWKPGLICLKGGDLTNELAELRDMHSGLRVENCPLLPLLGAPYFESKVIVTVHAESSS
ncbi:MAG: RsmG family class I SAM-dependent methyltransferase [Bacteroidota bacterium]